MLYSRTTRMPGETYARLNGEGKNSVFLIDREAAEQDFCHLYWVGFHRPRSSRW